MDGWSASASTAAAALAAAGAGAAGAGGASSEILERNLAAISKRSPGSAELIRAAAARDDLEFMPTPEGTLGLAIRPGLMTGRVTLASARAPAAEGARLAGEVDVVASPSACVLGFGAGYHVAALAERYGHDGVVLCFEPDLGLLRAVLERIDHSRALSGTNLIVCTDPEDPSELGRGLEGVQGFAVLGVRLLEHPASRRRLGAAAGVFQGSLSTALRAARMAIYTSLTRCSTSLRNALMNADHYATRPGIMDLAGAAAGRPAIVVSAGPSLKRNMAELARPGVRERFVIIAATTVLKPLLAAGIRPHYVCALDFSDVSRRFVEGIRAAEVEGVTLVVEPKVNPTVPATYPGLVRFTADERLDNILGDGARPMGDLWGGATVAHLCAYLARHLGCDPIVLVGQDLGFTDGQYYAGGAAIHEVWASELNEFRTLEMFEWERIARQGGQLRRMRDVLDRPIYSDEQMTAYLQHFESDFAKWSAQGARVIDATEGGVRKRHTEPMRLCEAIDGLIDGPTHELPPTPAGVDDPEGARRTLLVRLRTAARLAGDVGRLSREASEILGAMRGAIGDDPAWNALVERLDRRKAQVERSQPAWGLVQFASQTSTLKRFKADRALSVDRGLEPREVQRRRLERDAENVRWLAGSADEVQALLEHAAGVVRGERERLVRDEQARDLGLRVEPPAPTPGDSDINPSHAGPGRVEAVIQLDPRVGGLGQRRDLSRPVHQGQTALEMTARRLLNSARIAGVTIVAGDPELARSLLGPIGSDPRVAVIGGDGARIADRARWVGVGRLWSASSWRGGLAGLTCYDESFDPRELLGAMRARSLAAAVVVGADWALVDPALIDRIASIYLDHPDEVSVAFSQAPPGLGGFLVTRAAAESMAESTLNAPALSGPGGLLAYIPTLPMADVIARDFCVRIEPAVRDCGQRIIADAAPRVEGIGRAAELLGPSWARADAAAVVSALAAAGSRGGPVSLTLEVSTGRAGGGPWASRLAAAWGADDGSGLGERGPIDPDLAARVLHRVASGREDACLTLHGAGDPLRHPRIADIIASARSAGFAGVHLRTDLLDPEADLDRILSLGADVISVDALASTAATHRALTGTDRFAAVVQATQDAARAAILAAGPGGIPRPWIVPRITRCDEVYEEIEPFYTGWLRVTRAAIIDPLPHAPFEPQGRPQPQGQGASEAPPPTRIEPLPLPGHAARRLAREGLTVLSDGSVPGRRDGPREAGARAEVWSAPAQAIWSRLRRATAIGETVP